MSLPVSGQDVFRKPPRRVLYFTPATVEHASTAGPVRTYRRRKSDWREKSLHTKEEWERI